MATPLTTSINVIVEDPASEGPVRKFDKVIAFQDGVTVKGSKVRIISVLELDRPYFWLIGGIEQFTINITPAEQNSVIGYEYQLQIRNRDNTRWVKSNDWYDLGTRLSHVIRYRNLNVRLKENTYRIRIRAYYLYYRSQSTQWQSVDVNSLSENVTTIQNKAIVVGDRIISQGN